MARPSFLVQVCQCCICRSVAAAAAQMALMHASIRALAVFFCTVTLPGAAGHAYLSDPPPRNLITHWEGDEVCPHCLNANGPANVERRGSGVWPSSQAPGSHGLCGDPVQNRADPVSLKDEPYMIPSEPQRVYQAGSIVEFRVAVSTHHMGHYEFRICDYALDGRTLSSVHEGQKCLDARILHRAAPGDSCTPNDARGDCQPIDEHNPGRWYLPPPGKGTQTADALWDSSKAKPLPAVDEVHTMRFQIPADLTCTHCTLQWYYATANTCLPDEAYLGYFRDLQAAGWDAASWCPWALESWATKSNSCCGPEGKGVFPEEFWNCADITIVSSSSPSPSQPTPVPRPSPSPSQLTPVPRPSPSPSQPEPEPEPVEVCSWMTSTWSPCPATGCGASGLRVRSVSCWCGGVVALESRCDRQVRPTLEEPCKGACSPTTGRTLQPWAECGVRRIQGRSTQMGQCAESLECREYGSVWSQCEPRSLPRTPAPASVILRLGMQLPQGLDLCPDLSELGARVSAWAGASMAVATLAECQFSENRRLRWLGSSRNTRNEGMTDGQGILVDGSSFPKNVSARRLGSCPSNDVGCGCEWADATTCSSADDHSVCWCRCCCPLGGTCSSSGGKKTEEKQDASCAFPAGVPKTAASVDNRGFAVSHGKLAVVGPQLVDESGKAVQLMGMSSHGLHWFPACYTRDSVKYLAQHWGINVYRAAMYIGEGGYASRKSVLDSVKDIVDWCEELGIYVMIDWHVLTPGDPNHWLTGAGRSEANALEFWKDIAKLYKDKKHVLYEICNEPNGVEWGLVKSYADNVIAAIRSVDPDTVILVGTPTWSQDIHLAAANPVAQPHNVMYAFHFYAGSHRFLLDRVKQYASTLPIFVTEWGTSKASGDGGPYLETAKEFLDLFNAKETTGVLISWAQWSYADKAEVSAALKPGSCNARAWDQVSCSGSFLRSYLQSHVDTAFTPSTSKGATIATTSWHSTTPKKIDTTFMAKTSTGTTTVDPTLRQGTTPKKIVSTPPSLSSTATTTAAPMVVKGHMTMMVASPSDFMGDIQAHKGIAVGIANSTSCRAENIQLQFSLEGRRLEPMRGLNDEASRLVKAYYTIRVIRDVDPAKPYKIASSIASMPLSEWSAIFTSAADSSSRGGIAYTIDVTSVSSPSVEKLSTDQSTASSRIVDVEFSIATQSIEHSEVLSTRLTSTEHFAMLEDWLDRWLVQKYGAQTLQSTPEVAGDLLQWCEWKNGTGSFKCGAPATYQEEDNGDGSDMTNFTIALVVLCMFVLILVAVAVKYRSYCATRSRTPMSRTPVTSWVERQSTYECKEESSPRKTPQERKCAESRSSSASSSSSSLSGPIYSRCPALGHIFSSWGQQKRSKVHPVSQDESCRTHGADQSEVCDSGCSPRSLSSHWRDGFNWSVKLPNTVKSPRLMPAASPPARQLSDLS